VTPAHPPFTFAVVTDTHIRPPSGDTQAAYPSDARQNDRARRAVAMIRERDPAFVVHLGDIVNPLPGHTGHAEAVRTADEIVRAVNAHRWDGAASDRAGLGILRPPEGTGV